MAQLSPDCFAHGDAPLSLDEVRRLIGARVGTVAGVESVPLGEADGRVLADDVVAGLDLPPFDNAAVDGYAVRFAALAPGGPTHLPVAGRIAAGAPPLSGAEAEAAIRMFTGAPMPAGFDTVFMQEDVAILPDGRVSLPAGLAAGANRRRAGEDIRKGAVALQAGHRLTPRDLALLGALGQSSLAVRAQLRVALFSTGNEIAPDGAALQPGRIHDANRPMLAALLGRAGCRVSDLGTLPDEHAAVRDALLAAAAGHDAIVTSGGVSAGDEDHVRGVVEREGTLAFWRVAIRPGRPVAAGTIGDAAFLGLPGNPVAAFVTFAFVARPILARLGGETYRPPAAIPVPSAFAHRKRLGRREFLRASLLTAPDGSLRLAKVAQDGSNLLHPLAATDGLAELPEDLVDIAVGDPVGFIPYGTLV